MPQKPRFVSGVQRYVSENHSYLPGCPARARGKHQFKLFVQTKQQVVFSQTLCRRMCVQPDTAGNHSLTHGYVFFYSYRRVRHIRIRSTYVSSNSKEVPMKCCRCGSEALVNGAVYSPIRTSFRPQGSKFLTLETGDIQTKAFMCKNCGHVEIIGDAMKLRRLTSDTGESLENT